MQNLINVKMRWALPLLAILLLQCRRHDPLDVDVSNIPVKVHIDRFDRKFYGASPAELPALKKAYPLLFAPGVPDSVWAAKMQDSLLLRLKQQVDSVYPDNRFIEQELTGVFKHVKYYFPGFRTPRTVTLFSDWDYTKRSLMADTLHFLFIDNFLGRDNPVYAGVPLYIAQTMTPRHLAVFTAASVAEQKVPYPQTHSLLNKMIYYGKILYLTRAFVPQVPDSILLGYSAPKMKWAKENEANVWLYFLDNKLLYSTDPKLDARFLDLSPFSKFYAGIDNQSPGMIGRYLGYRIVQAYMRRTRTPVQELPRKSAYEIFRQSKYKPE